VHVRSVHHVAFAVSDLDEAVQTYERFFGARVELRDRMETEGVEAVYLRVGDGRIELVTPLADDTPVGRFLASRGPGMHHVAFEVSDIARAIEDLSAAGAEVIDPEPRPGLAGREVAFVHPDSLHGVLAEVVGG
jgi:methylmalonyl-CoA epimerase